MFDDYSFNAPYLGYTLPSMNHGSMGTFNSPFNQLGAFSTTPNLFASGAKNSLGGLDLDLDFFSQVNSLLNFDFLSAFLKSGSSNKFKGKANVKDLKPKMKDAFAELTRRAKAQGINFGVVSGFRTHEHQQYLYATKPKGYAAVPGTSLHEKGLAVDLQASPEDLKKLGKIWTEMGYNWGGTWSKHTENWHFDLKPAKKTAKA